MINTKKSTSFIIAGSVLEFGVMQIQHAEAANEFYQEMPFDALFTWQPLCFIYKPMCVSFNCNTLHNCTCRQDYYSTHNVLCKVMQRANTTNQSDSSGPCCTKQNTIGVQLANSNVQLTKSQMFLVQLERTESLSQFRTSFSTVVVSSCQNFREGT